jgi:hypothetical protein
MSSSSNAYQAPSQDSYEEKWENPNPDQPIPNFNQSRAPRQPVPGPISRMPYTNKNFLDRIAEQNRESQDLSGMLTAAQQDMARIIGTFRGNVNKYFDTRDKQIPGEMQELMKDIQLKLEIIPDTDDDYDTNNPDFFIRLARDEDFKSFVIGLFDLRNEQMGRPETLRKQIQSRKSKETSSTKYRHARDMIDARIIDEEMNRPYSDAAIGIVIASLLLSNDVDLTVSPQSDRDDLVLFLKELKNNYFRETGKLGKGGKRSKKVKYGRKRKTKRRRGTKKKSKRRHRTKRR